MRKNRLINQKDIKVILGYAAGLPSLENKFRSLSNTVLDLEIKKKEVSTQLLDLGHVISQYKSTFDSKQQQLMRISQPKKK